MADVSTEWLDEACRVLHIDRASVDDDALLKLAKVVAHRVERKAAPLSTFLAGVAVGRGAELDVVARELRELASRGSASADGAR